MPYAAEETGDFQKLQIAFQDITKRFGSVDDVLEAFGLADLPTAQRYGILFGCLTFFCTVSAVLTLLVMGGTFKRVAEQAKTGEATIESAHTARRKRALLLEQLLEGRERMMRSYPEPPRTEKFTNLTTMLMNVAPKETEEVADLVAEEKKVDKEKIRRSIPPYYEENYVTAYRRCQDRPGGAVLSGRPEARYEAYARGFAGCGPYTTPSYRRSYGRVYEAVACDSHATDDKYTELWKTRPQDIVGKYVRLEPLEVDRHLEDLYKVTSGQPVFGYRKYSPEEVWAFTEDGPFESPADMRKSFVFQRKMDEASFGIVDAVMDRLVGAILLVNDDPKNLSIQMELPLLSPMRDGTKEQLEACFLLLDRLFAHGYRRIQISIDSQDAVKRKLATRLGFMLEGVLFRHQIVRDSSRDSNIYSMLNSDWKKGARDSLFRTLYGVKGQRGDAANEAKEAELEEQNRVKREKEAAAAVKKSKDV